MRHLLLLFVSFFSLQVIALDISVSAEGAILINAKTGAILYEKNANVPTYPASTTKIATALYALELCDGDLSKILTAKREAIASITPEAKRQSNYRSPPYWLETDGSHVGIKEGEKFSLHDLLHATLICSANDASNVIAHNLAKNIPEFMEGVNGYVQALGCTNTSFNNPHGLHHPDHVTTPHDLALIAKKGLENDFFREVVKTVRYTCPETNLEHERHFTQTNRLLKRGAYYYPKAIGVKTGTTKAAGKNLVAAAQENGRTLIAVLLGYRESSKVLYDDITRLFETAFNEPMMRRTLLPKGVQKLVASVPGGRGKLKTTLPEGLYYDFYPSEECPVKAKVIWQLPELPILPMQQVGLIQVLDPSGTVLQITPLLAHKKVNPTLLYRAKAYLGAEKRGRKVLFILGMSGVLWLLWRRRGKRRRRPLYR